MIGVLVAVVSDPGRDVVPDLAARTDTVTVRPAPARTSASRTRGRRRPSILKAGSGSSVASR